MPVAAAGRWRGLCHFPAVMITTSCVPAHRATARRTRVTRCRRTAWQAAAAIELALPASLHGQRHSAHGVGRERLRHHPGIARRSGRAIEIALPIRTLHDVIDASTPWPISSAETCDIPRETIKPESHAINDLGIDSLDFLDIAFAIDKAFGIKMPLEQWTQRGQRRQGDD